jgi:hypothetical protein
MTTRVELNLNVRIPDSVPREQYEELRAMVADHPTAVMLAQIAQHAGRDNVAFVGCDIEGMTVIDDESASEVVFAIGNDVMYPDSDDEPLGPCLQRLVMRHYVAQGPADDEVVMQALMDAIRGDANSPVP